MIYFLSMLLLLGVLGPIVQQKRCSHEQDKIPSAVDTLWPFICGKCAKAECRVLTPKPLRTIPSLTFSDPVRIKSRELPAGSYALFAIPKQGVMTIVLNSVAKQWGAFKYDESKDVLRFDLQPEKAPFTEWMTFEMTPAPKNVARVEWQWERLRFSFDLEVDVEKIVWSRIDAVLAKDTAAWDDYLSAAHHAWEEKTRLEDAKRWVDRSIALKEHFWNDELKARLLANEGKYAEAIPLLEKAKELAKDKAPKEYVEGLDKQLVEWRAKNR